MEKDPLRPLLYLPPVFLALIAATDAIAGGVAANTGLDDLAARIGEENLPTGAGVEVGQVETVNDDGDYGPDTTHANFPDKTFNMMSGATGVLNHASTVGFRIYGTSQVGIAPGIDTIYCYNAEEWLLYSYLRVASSSSTFPYEPPGEVAIFNNSWVATFGDDNYDKIALRRADWAVGADDVMMISGMPNSGDPYPLMVYMFNGVSVGIDGGGHVSDPVPAPFDGAGRQIPLIVGPQNSTSNATGIVSAATALLIETARTHPNTSGNFFSTLSETIKVTLLAGGLHEVGWTNNPATGGANRGRTSQPIDDIYGVGTVNVDRSWQVMTGGQHGGDSSPDSMPVAPYAAWDVASLLNGGSRFYKFSTQDVSDEVSILLLWHQKVNTGFSSYSMADLDLQLWGLDDKENLVDITGDAGIDVFDSGNVVSESNVDNVEHLYIRDLAPGEYALEVSRDDSAGSTRIFGVAWLFPEPAGGVPGDVNGDGVVNVNDLLALISAWGPCSGDCPADINGDGTVNVQDLLELLSLW